MACYSRDTQAFGLNSTSSDIIYLWNGNVPSLTSLKFYLSRDKILGEFLQILLSIFSLTFNLPSKACSSLCECVFFLKANPL